MLHAGVTGATELRLEKAFRQASELIVELDEISGMAGIRRLAEGIYSFIEQTVPSSTTRDGVGSGRAEARPESMSRALAAVSVGYQIGHLDSGLRGDIGLGSELLIVGDQVTRLAELAGGEH